jgi:hypothetical protein
VTPEALARAERLYPKSTAFRSAYLKGVRAKSAGRPQTACPYARASGSGWTRAFRLAWTRGYLSEE